jgi:Tfp pilus assembly protein PilP
MRVLFTAVGIIAFSGSLIAQSKVPVKTASKTPAKVVAKAPEKPASAPAPADVEPTAGPDEYSYKPEGRRDPFLGLNAAAPDVPSLMKRGDGVGGFLVGEISVRGVMQSRSRLVAMIKGPDNKTYLIHQGDKLADGVVKTVTPQGLVVLQDISDPLSAQKQREVRKLLRSLEDAKEKL